MLKKNFAQIMFIFLAIIPFISGCKKEKSKLHKQSFFSKVKEKYSKKSDKETTSTIKAFDLSDDSMKSFALNDTLPQHTSNLPTIPEATNKLVAWENEAADDSKNTFKRLLFEFNSYVLQPNQQKNLKFDIKQAKQMIKDGKTIVIEGHACHSAGSAIYNLALSEKRARYVAKQFADANIDPQNIKIAPRGQEMPLIKGGNREQQALNRRVEIFAIEN